MAGNREIDEALEQFFWKFEIRHSRRRSTIVLRLRGSSVMKSLFDTGISKQAGSLKSFRFLWNLSTYF